MCSPSCSVPSATAHARPASATVASAKRGTAPTRRSWPRPPAPPSRPPPPTGGAPVCSGRPWRRASINPGVAAHRAAPCACHAEQTRPLADAQAPGRAGTLPPMRLATFKPPGSRGPARGYSRGRPHHRVRRRAPHSARRAGNPRRSRRAPRAVGRDRRPGPVVAAGGGHAARARAQRPRAIFGIGLNYADHVAETGGERPRSRWCS